MSNADRALASAIAVLRDVAASKTLTAYAKNPRIAARLGADWRVALGFGLHVGWAIEGAIGSRHKVDPSYLSPHVNLAARLESATKLYGVQVLMSDAFVSALLVEEHHEAVRQIDCVRLKGSVQPMGLFTYDDPDSVRASLGSVSYAAYQKAFAEGLESYLQGDWPDAAERLGACARDWPADAPAKGLVTYMATYQNVAPKGWAGVRDLMEK